MGERGGARKRARWTGCLQSAETKADLIGSFVKGCEASFEGNMDLG